MQRHESADKAAIALGLITGVALVCVGTELSAAAIGGGLVALAVDLPFGSITHAVHHGRLHRPLVAYMPRPPKLKTHTAKPTGYPRGSFGRL